MNRELTHQGKCFAKLVVEHEVVKKNSKIFERLYKDEKKRVNRFLTDLAALKAELAIKDKAAELMGSRIESEDGDCNYLDCIMGEDKQNNCDPIKCIVNHFTDQAKQLIEEGK